MYGCLHPGLLRYKGMICMLLLAILKWVTIPYFWCDISETCRYTVIPYVWRLSWTPYMFSGGLLFSFNPPQHNFFGYNFCWSPNCNPWMPWFPFTVLMKSCMQFGINGSIILGFICIVKPQVWMHPWPTRKKRMICLALHFSLIVRNNPHFSLDL